VSTWNEKVDGNSFHDKASKLKITAGTYLTYIDEKNEVIHTLDDPTFESTINNWDDFNKIYEYHSDIPFYQPVSYKTEDVSSIIYAS